MNQSITSGHTPINGLSMYYEIHGNGGTPLVLIHGGGSTIETSFGTMLPLLSAHFKIVAVELQAHGRTSDRDAPESFEQDADDVAALLQYLKIDRANIFGFSNGGTTALQMAIRHPNITSKIINLTGSYQREGFIAGFFEGFTGATLSNMPEQLRAAFLKVTPDERLLQNMFEKDVVRMVNFKDIADADMQSIKAKTLIITSDKDVMPAEHAVKMARLIPEASLLILPGIHGQCIGTLESGTEQDSKLPGITAVLIQNFLLNE